MTVRKETIGACDLYLGDCREVLPALGSVDTIIVDPVWPNAPAGMFDVACPQSLMAEALELVEASRLVVILRYDSDPRFLASVPSRWAYFRTCILNYALPSKWGRTLGGMEIAYCFGAAIKSGPGRHIMPGMAPPSQPGENASNGHPCPRALSHMRWLVNWYSDPLDAVLDPFMGSGTTGVACVKLGRRFVGIEIEPKYFDIACRRIEGAYKQPDLFIERPLPAKQLELDAAE